MKIQPKDPSKNHFRVSLVKSVLRIGAGAFLIGGASGAIIAAGVLIILAEILGIVEEIV